MFLNTTIYTHSPQILKFSLMDDEVQIKVQLNSSGCQYYVILIVPKLQFKYQAQVNNGYNSALHVVAEP